MSLSQRRKELEAALKERNKRLYDTKDDSGMYKNIFKDDLTLPLWKCKEGDHIIDILPYIAGEGNIDNSVRKGDLNHVAIYWEHRKVGPTEDNFLCLARNYNSDCPICEHIRELRDAGEDDAAKKLYPKKMTIYNILCLDNDKEEEKGVQIWLVSYHLMEKFLEVLAKLPRGGGHVPYAHPDKGIGKSIRFTREGMKQDNTKYLGHSFMDRDYDIPDDLLNAAYCLESLVHIPTYDEVSKAFWGKGNQKNVREEQEVEVEREREKAMGAMLAEPGVCPDPEGVFGKDIDKLDYCTDCNNYDGCMVENSKPKPIERTKPVERPTTTRRRLRNE